MEAVIFIAKKEFCNVSRTYTFANEQRYYQAKDMLPSHTNYNQEFDKELYKNKDRIKITVCNRSQGNKSISDQS